VSDARPGRFLGVTTRTLFGLGILLLLVERNATHVAGFVTALVAAWGEVQTRHEMAFIATALEAEYVSLNQYPSPASLTDFIQTWIPKEHRDDPTLDYWKSEYRLEVEGDVVTLKSCGPDRQCGTKDDVDRPLSFPGASDNSPYR